MKDAEYKVIHDPIHGSIRIEGLVLELMETLELQRLNGIRQLGLSYLIFPGANHTRIEHSLGVCHIVRKIAEALKLSKEEYNMVTAASLLHDAGHSPYSHTLEAVIHSTIGVEHMKLTKEIITGRFNIIQDINPKSIGAKSIPEILEDNALRPKDVAGLIEGGRREFWRIDEFMSGGGGDERRYLAQMIHGAIDADQMDYLLRDAHYTGVAYGAIDLDRILQTIGVFKNELVIHEKGMSAVESMFVARALMYSSVYYHKTVRIAEQMLARTVEKALKKERVEVHRMTDSELFEWLKGLGGEQRERVLMLKYRRLFKKVLMKGIDELSEDEKVILLNLEKDEERQRKEEEICRKAGIPKGSVIIDIPLPELLLSEPRIADVDINIQVGNKLKPFSKLSPLGRVLKMRDVSKWVVLVYAHPKYREKVEKVTERVLFG